ncbi:unnamed protein product [Rotaria socialis]|uniref:Uncharacterized protein n=1 Tax=Rotaria socialis TaxID=392032 RepID=A0A820DZ38_9BILA|nr:unnamed protein product [Rotaria socialis]CAF3318515.1 unnamed protein product [Rotaria socialis]CAF4240253.1 unnamed protein product [Rotaria socialis]CAF4422755.1 unnamed protein product [Rotaria socialis]
MSQPCSIEKCTLKSRALCDCCQQSLCLKHLNENNDVLVSKLNSLCAEINVLEDRFNTLRIETIIGASREKLERWHKHCREKIDLFFEKQLQEFDEIIRPEGSYLSLAANDQYLLIKHDPDLTFHDREMSLVKKTQWTHGKIREMCWSSTLNKFIILGVDSIFLLDKDKMPIDNVYTIEGRTWLSCTCSNAILYAPTDE